MSEETWASLVSDYLRRDAPGKRPILVVLDGIDEAIGWEMRPSIIPLTLGRGISVLVTARMAVYTPTLRALSLSNACHLILVSVVELDQARDAVES